jgi:hypothetical protein
MTGAGRVPAPDDENAHEISNCADPHIKLPLVPCKLLKLLPTEVYRVRKGEFSQFSDENRSQKERIRR